MTTLAIADSFAPSEADPKAFRNALGQFATGVTVVTCMTPQGPLGMTANSFSSLSLDPPLVLWSPARSSSRHEAFVTAPHFAIHVLSAEQEALCTGFARDGRDFGAADWNLNADGAPVLDGCLSCFACRRSAVHPGGDHSIVVGEVTHVTTRQGAPLLFHGGRYGRLAL